jgi:hypothetical protein
MAQPFVRYQQTDAWRLLHSRGLTHKKAMLLTIANILSIQTGVPKPTRDEIRQLPRLILWFDRHFMLLAPLLYGFTYEDGIVYYNRQQVFPSEKTAEELAEETEMIEFDAVYPSRPSHAPPGYRSIAAQIEGDPIVMNTGRHTHTNWVASQRTLNGDIVPGSAFFVPHKDHAPVQVPRDQEAVLQQCFQGTVPHRFPQQRPFPWVAPVRRQSTRRHFPMIEPPGFPKL